MKRIPLTKGKFALVDDSDFEWLNQWKWQYSNGYAARGKLQNGKAISIKMHRIICNTPSGCDTDHINGNPLDNTRCNLRVCSRQENSRNRKSPTKLGKTSKYKGVYFDKGAQKWAACIQISGKTIFLGRFNLEALAAAAYDAAAGKHFGQFARGNGTC